MIVNLSLNQILLTFLLSVRQTWMTQLILAISLWEVIFFNSKGFWHSYAWSRSFCEKRTSCCKGLISRKLFRFLHMFSTGFTSLCLTSFSSIDHLLCLCARYLILFHLTWMRFSRSIHLLVCLSLETLTSITGTGLLTLVELIDLVNSVIIFL